MYSNKEGNIYVKINSKYFIIPLKLLKWRKTSQDENICV